MSSLHPAARVGSPDPVGDADGRVAIRKTIHAYIVENLLFDGSQTIEDSASLVEAGILDSTGAMELVAFLETVFGLKVADEDLIPDNLDSVGSICAFVERKRAAAAAVGR